jgi:hypothetical protein
MKLEVKHKEIADNSLNYPVPVEVEALETFALHEKV